MSLRLLYLIFVQLCSLCVPRIPSMALTSRFARPALDP